MCPFPAQQHRLAIAVLHPKIVYIPLHEHITLSQGALVSLFGMWVQFQAHRTLARLRPADAQRKGNNAIRPLYHLPRGGGFEYVSCPHYFGEIIIYAGLLLILGPFLLLPWLLFALVVRFLHDNVPSAEGPGLHLRLEANRK